MHGSLDDGPEEAVVVRLAHRDVPVIGDGGEGAPRGERLRQRHVGARVHEPERLLNPLVGGEAAAHALLRELEQLEAQHVVERAGRRVALNRRVHSGGHTTVRPEMATFDQLSPEQRAIVELVLRQGKTYAELSDMLDLPEGRVRELARDALVELAPVSVRGVEEDWRGQLADYVLGQQSGPEATATKGHLRRSEAARSWARSLLDSLEQFYENGSVPAIPDGERGRRAAAAAPREPREPREPRSAMGGRLAPTADRRWLMAGAAALIVILLAVVIWPIGALTGDDDDKSSGDTSSSGTQGQNQSQQNATGQTSGQPAGIAIVVQRNGKKQLLVQATSLTPSGQSEGYYVWLYNSPNDAKSLGGQVTDQNGNYQAIGPLPADFKSYKFIDVSRQQIANSGTVKHSGESVLRGKMPVLKKADVQNGKTAAIGQTVLKPPAG